MVQIVNSYTKDPIFAKNHLNSSRTHPTRDIRLIPSPQSEVHKWNALDDQALARIETRSPVCYKWMCFHFLDQRRIIGLENPDIAFIDVLCSGFCY